MGDFVFFIEIFQWTFSKFVYFFLGYVHHLVLLPSAILSLEFFEGALFLRPSYFHPQYSPFVSSFPQRYF